MPSNWLYIDTNFPTFTGEEETEEKVSSIQNYLFMLVEQLRYSLRNLDLKNMNPAAVERFTGTITEPIYGRIEDAEGNITQLGITAKGLEAKISDAEGNINSLQVTATKLASQISDANGNISRLQQTATKLESQIRDANGDISQLQQTASSIMSTVSNQAGQISQLWQTASGIQSTVTNQAGQISVLQQRADGFQTIVADQNANISAIQQSVDILSAKQDYNSAATPEQKLLANERANALRRHYGYYSGGSDGSQYISTGRLPGQIDSKLEEIGSFGSFDYGKAAPSYDNAYAREQQRLLDSIINRPDFSWSKETDPQWSSYKKSYLREGERATADALGQASAASGGRPSSYAVNAATQAGDYYATKLNDVIPTLYQQAYDRYLKEFQMQQQALDAVNGQEQLDYNRYLTELGQYNTDRDFAYNAYTNDYNRLLSQLGAFQGEEDRQYGRYNDSVDRALQLDALTRERQANEQNFYQQVLDTMLQSGASPSQELVTRSGYPGEYVQALENLYKQQALSRAGGRSGGSSGGSGKSGGGADMDYDGLFAAAMESGHPRSFISNNYKKFGFSSNSGLWSDYQNWAEGQENDPVTAFNNGDRSNGIVEQLLAMGYTEADLKSAGYTGGYFSNGDTAKSGNSVNGGNNGTVGTMGPDTFKGVKRTIETMLGRGNTTRADEVIDSVWDNMDAAQKEAIRVLMKQYGYGVEE